MKLCVAQTRPVKGDVESNIYQHQKLIEQAVLNDVEIIIFPELSLTGYEPELADALATTKDDIRFRLFQHLADTNKISIGVGMPLREESGICIAMLLFQPDEDVQVYAKQYIHPDEEAFFVSGENTIGLIGADNSVALAICYELSVPAHAEDAAKKGAAVYIASVAKSKEGVDKAAKRLSDIAGAYSMTVLMSNAIGASDGFISGGRSAVWSNKGLLIAELDNLQEGLLITDTDTSNVYKKIIL